MFNQEHVQILQKYLVLFYKNSLNKINNIFLPPQTPTQPPTFYHRINDIRWYESSQITIKLTEINGNYEKLSSNTTPTGREGMGFLPRYTI